MSAAFNRWCESRRYRCTLRALLGLTEGELGALLLTPADIDRVARECSRR